MMRSDIFNNFAKIAQEQGIISNDSSKAAKELEKTRRADSLSISAIEALYGVKNEIPKDMSYEKNIMESAHDNNVVISPAYDKLNSLFENNIERQNILLRIVNKNPDGLLTQRKYAQNDLILSLVRVANNLDNHDKDQLRILADSCLHSIKKEAIGPWAIAGLVAATVGISYAIMHAKDANFGFAKNHEELIEQLEELKDGDITLGVGVKLNDKGKQIVENVISQLNAIKNAYNEIMPTLISSYEPHSLQQLSSAYQEVSQEPLKYKELAKKYIFLKKAVENIKPLLKGLKELFENKTLVSALIEQEGSITGLIEGTQFLHGGYGFVPNDFDDVIHAMPAYVESLNELLVALRSAKDKILEQKRILQEQKAREAEFITNVEHQLDKQSPMLNGKLPENTLSQYEGLSGMAPSMPGTTLPQFDGLSGIGKVPSSQPPSTTLDQYKEFLNSPDAFSLMK